MTAMALSNSPADLALATARRARIAMLVVHLPAIGFLVLNTTTTLLNNPDPVPALLPAVLAIAGLQLYISVTVANGTRPRAGFLAWVSILVLAVVVAALAGYVGQVAFWFVGASGAMVLPGRAGAAVFLGSVLAIVVGASESYEPTSLTPEFTAFIVYALTAAAVGTTGMYVAVRLVPVVDELLRTRAELALSAVDRERRRFSRDLHDALGQGLAAIALKGDLAWALLGRDQSRARREADDIVVVAEALLNDLSQVTHADRVLSFAAEVRAAAGLLEDAGIEVRLDIDLQRVAPEIDALFGWAMREGATNALRHSAARQVDVRAGPAGEWARLELINDGAAAQSSGAGTGLAGLAERARELGGSAEWGRDDGGRFRLRVLIPRREP
jgi:two-component system, NarL family, sensor histidine kinase DesK